MRMKFRSSCPRHCSFASSRRLFLLYVWNSCCSLAVGFSLVVFPKTYKPFKRFLISKKAWFVVDGPAFRRPCYRQGTDSLCMSHYSSKSDEPEHGVWKSNLSRNMKRKSLHNVRLNFVGVSQWRGLSFIQVWEKDPYYCLHIAKMKSPVKLSMNRESENLAMFKVFMLLMMESVKLENIYIAGHDDIAGNMRGSITEKPTKPYSSHKRQWIGDTGCRWPCLCCVEGCTNKPMDGAHIFRSGSGSCYIAPMCQRCNFNRANDLVAFKDMAEYTFPFKLRQGTWCLKVEDIHISCQGKSWDHASRKRAAGKIDKKNSANYEQPKDSTSSA